jgi:hypothetical protein
MGYERPQVRVCTGGRLRQSRQQHPGLLEIGGVKPFGEPAVDPCKQRMHWGTDMIVDHDHGVFILRGSFFRDAFPQHGLAE